MEGILMTHINENDGYTNADFNAMGEDYIVSLADSMAAAASSFNSHGYDQFIMARDSFKNRFTQFVRNINR
jgi:hypothetical protein